MGFTRILPRLRGLWPVRSLLFARVFFSAHFCTSHAGHAGESLSVVHSPRAVMCKPSGLVWPPRVEHPRGLFLSLAGCPATVAVARDRRRYDYGSGAGCTLLHQSGAALYKSETVVGPTHDDIRIGTPTGTASIEFVSNLRTEVGVAEWGAICPAQLLRRGVVDFVRRHRASIQ